jgi:hypothetical protein
MDVLTIKPLLDKIRAGFEGEGAVPCPPDKLPVPGDVVTFREAAFQLGAPSLVPNGDSTSVTLTSVSNTHVPYHGVDAYEGFTICTLRWDAVERAGKPE